VNYFRPEWPAPGSIEAICTTRQNGHSLSPFDSFNLANHVGDNDKQVADNRGELMRVLKLPSQPCWLSQTHSTRVAYLHGSGSYEADSDSAVTREINKIAVVMTADCLPILLCNRIGSEVAAIHAGWRGLVDGIIENTLDKLDSDPAQLLAWVGPAISQSRFEVSREVFDLFVEKDIRSGDYFSSNRPGHWLCNLPGLAEQHLRQQGLTDIFQSGLCSFDDASRFYSYRRSKITGRMACLIWINSKA